MKDATLVIFAKRPVLNSGKQRLLSQYDSQQVLEIAELLLECSLEDARNWPGNVVFAVAEERDLKWAESLALGGNSICTTQGGQGNLGARIHYVDKYTTELGYRKKIILGTDAPAMTSGMLHSAVAALSHNHFVFIPARDGGVTLLGNTESWPDLKRLPWCSSNLGPELIEACRRVGPVALLPESFDIDVPGDLVHFQRKQGSDTRLSRKKLLVWLENSG